MGWIFECNPSGMTREQALDRYLPNHSGWTNDDGTKCAFDHLHWTAQGVWGRLTVQHPGKDPVQMIAFYRIRKESGCWGSGGLWPEYCGPFETGCPISLLRLVPVPPPVEYCHGVESHGWAMAFRKRVVDEHALKQAGRAKSATLEIGDRIDLPEGWNVRTLIVSDIRNRKIYGTRPNDALLFRITPRILRSATVTKGGAA